MVSPDEKEFLSRTELCELFDIAKINKAGAVFDTVKLTWMNKHYVANQTDETLISLIHPFLSNDLKQIPQLDQKIISVRDTLETLSQINHYLGVYNQSNQDVFEKFKLFNPSATDAQVIAHVAQELKGMTQWTPGIAQSLIDNTMAALNLGKGKVMKPIRKSMTGDESGPNLVDCLALIPLEDIVARVEMINDHVKSTTPH